MWPNPENWVEIGITVLPDTHHATVVLEVWALVQQMGPFAFAGWVPGGPGLLLGLNLSLHLRLTLTVMHQDKLDPLQMFLHDLLVSFVDSQAGLSAHRQILHLLKTNQTCLVPQERHHQKPSPSATYPWQLSFLRKNNIVNARWLILLGQAAREWRTTSLAKSILVYSLDENLLKLKFWNRQLIVTTWILKFYFDLTPFYCFLHSSHAGKII